MEELYKRHRPTTFDLVEGQEVVVSQLKTFLQNGELPHSLLLTGPSGCGKTTLARILRTELGCADGDYEEKDAAVFRGIDSVREIHYRCKFRPRSGPCSVWLLDECQKQTPEAQEALLKLLEDTPSWVYFILATTDPQKLISTIRNRCTILNLTLVDDESLYSIAKRVSAAEKLDFTQSTFDQLVIYAKGSPRRLLVKLHELANQDCKNHDEILNTEAEHDAILICNKLFDPRSAWKDLVPILETVSKKQDADEVRYLILAYAKTVLCKGKGSYPDRAHAVIEEFRQELHYCKWPGFYANCYAIMNQG